MLLAGGRLDIEAYYAYCQSPEMKTTGTLLTFHALERHYPGFRLGPISLELAAGTVLAIVGENGSGKTTTLRLAAGWSRPDRGRVDAGDARIGFASGEDGFFERWTVERNLRLVSTFYDDWDHAYAVGLCERLKLRTDDVVKRLSKGGRTKLQLVAAIAAKPTLLLLDEPTEGLDPLIRVELFDVLRERQEDPSNAILWCTHLLADIPRFADEIAFLEDGAIVAHSATPDLIETSGTSLEQAALDILKGARSHVAVDRS